MNDHYIGVWLDGRLGRYERKLTEAEYQAIKPLPNGFHHWEFPAGSGPRHAGYAEMMSRRRVMRDKRTPSDPLIVIASVRRARKVGDPT